MLLIPKLNDIGIHAQRPMRDIASMQVCRDGVKALENANILEKKDAQHQHDHKVKRVEKGVFSILLPYILPYHLHIIVYARHHDDQHQANFQYGKNQI